MRFLVDECLPKDLVTALAVLGHDVIWAAEHLRGQQDPALLDRALIEGRILLTEDDDFSGLVFATDAKAVGVVRVDSHRVPGRIKAFVPEVIRLILDRGDQLVGQFTVIEPGRVRSRPLPGIKP